ncbi:MAG: branched-chain amino acid aminotransferase [Sphingobium sp.]|uniref:branched-chain amino acid aminotransferase n=1 Tax=Sphingobium sp. TaxID=1912891 RepID=UPI0029A3676C|nr:branched-chain amino acid aminotransferase [Sphingobium sp.]MDX3908495.1 branched-chain amino acid aminotransferase [Sphingobium sp.]
MIDSRLEFNVIPNATPATADVREAMLVDPGFGRVFTDHMVTIRYAIDKGWHDATVGARAPIPMDPATSVLHYAQEIFEGMKAYRLNDGTTALFRPDANARRFRESAKRMAMPELPEDVFLESVRQLVSIDQAWIPGGDLGSLYLRPFMFASEVFLGVRPAHEYLYVVIASSVGAYFKGGSKAVSIWVSQDYSRAASGGTGAAKCGGNYAASLVAQAQANEQGCDQVAFLDAAERRWIEELGGMNLFFVFSDGTMATPPLTGTILPGITRDSVLTMAHDLGLSVREEPYSFADWRADAASGRLTETFACGTAAVVTAVGTVKSVEGDFVIGDGKPGPTTERILQALTSIQRGTAPDPHGWVNRLI